MKSRTLPFSRKDTRVEIRSMNRVVAVDPSGKIVGEATRNGPGNQWWIRKLHFGVGMITAARVDASLSEVLQRKLVVAILKEF